MQRKAPSAQSARGIGSWVVQVLAWMFILSVGAILAVAVVIPRLGGATPYTVLTSSMRPDMPPGTLVVVKPTDTDRIAVGTVVTYQLESGKPTVVTHRVVAKAYDGTGAVLYQTQGDANDAPDQNWVKPVQIKGATWYSVPYLGRLNTLLTGHQRQTAVYLVAAGLLGYAGFMFGGALLGGRRTRRHQDESAPQSNRDEENVDV